MTAARGGDAGAFGVLYDRHRRAARRLAGALVHDPEDADDLVADAAAEVSPHCAAAGCRAMPAAGKRRTWRAAGTA